MSLPKAWHERIHGSGTYEMDEIDRAILAKRIEEWNRYTEPRVGDYVITPKGYLRFTHDWGEDIQTTVRPGYDASFYFGKGGYMSFSGSLDPGVPKALLELTDEVREGSCWFFSHDHAEAHNGVYTSVPCRVWRLKEQS